MNNRIALAVSVIFHPLIITSYLFAVIFVFAPELLSIGSLELPAMGSLLLLIFLNTFIAPSILIYYMYRLGLISTLHVEDRRERHIPYLVSIIIYGIATYLFGWRFQPISELAPQIGLVLGSVTLSLVVILLISFFWKISAHATGIGGFIGFLTLLILRNEADQLFIPLIISILLAGIVLSARLQLNAHSLAQIAAGFGCGLVISSLTVYFYF